MTRNSNRTSVVLLLLFAFPVTALAQHQVHPALGAKYVLEAGVFFPKLDFDASVNGNLGAENPDLDFEEHFGLSEYDSIGAAEFTWRYGRLWSLRAQYFEGGRSATNTLLRDVPWGDAIFRAGTSVTAESGLVLLRLFTGRNFSKSDNMDYGVGFGIHRIEIDAALSGEFFVNDTVQREGTRKVGTTAPLPNIGGWYYWSPGPKWYLGGRLDWMDVDLGDYAGGLVNFALGVNYQAFEHVGIGLKYQTFAVRLKIREPQWEGKAKLEYQGMYLHFTVNWK